MKTLYIRSCIERLKFGASRSDLSIIALATEEISENDAELSALRERVEAYHEQIAEVNELLWEFTENPNIEMGETGHEKIEDYFKKYSSNAESPAP